ncbi:phage portal protein [Clostridium gasigenes]|uniref:phage portal protein n=1 Tax=Clostridium gasigenes TaxID=94869 RepID=UPI001C0E4158|nr:phage portal protein [Clostridium gasigenes]MBU3102982.1 phage portal protein [Clostridium gasigenes]
MTIKETLLKLSDKEKKEREKARKDYFFYLGETENKEAAILDNSLLGQSWITLDDLDYMPSQIIDNKIKPLINKQARFMFGKEPDILFKPFDKKDKETCEELRQYVDAILNASKFWSNTLKAFRLATVTKRVMLRIEANPGQPIRIYYHDINDFNYVMDINDITKLKSVTLIRQDAATANKEVTEQLWYRYTYYMGNEEGSEELSCYLKKETFKGNDLDIPIDIEDKDTGLSKIPCWIITNEQSITNPFGVTDIKDMKPLQDSYNRRLSDFNDSLRFLMFGQTVFIDAKEEGVNSAKIAPNSVIALVSIDDEVKKAQAIRLESSFSNSEPVDKFLTRLENSMYEKLSIPRPEQIANVPSGKALGYLYIELVGRSDEKWNDWEPPIRSMIRLIVEACGKFKCYSDWKKEWSDLDYSIVINKNYPIPEDIDSKKKSAIEEVQNNVRSHRSYIKDFTDDENYEEQFNEVIEDITTINSAEQDQFQKSIDSELNKGKDTGGDS